MDCASLPHILPVEVSVTLLCRGSPTHILKYFQLAQKDIMSSTTSCATVEPLVRCPPNPRPPLLLSLSIWPGSQLTFSAGTCLGLDPHLDLVVFVYRLGEEALIPWDDSWAHSYVGTDCQKDGIICLMCQLSLCLSQPDEHLLPTTVDQQLLSREALQSCDNLIWHPNLPHNLILLKSLWVLYMSSQRTSRHKRSLL